MNLSYASPRHWYQTSMIVVPFFSWRNSFWQKCFLCFGALSLSLSLSLLLLSLLWKTVAGVDVVVPFVLGWIALTSSSPTPRLFVVMLVVVMILVVATLRKINVTTAPTTRTTTMRHLRRRFVVVSDMTTTHQRLFCVFATTRFGDLHRSPRFVLCRCCCCCVGKERKGKESHTGKIRWYSMWYPSSSFPDAFGKPQMRC